MKIINTNLRERSEAALHTFREEYAREHQTRINRQLHFYGRIVRVSALIFLFFNWKIALIVFVIGYLMQFLGHAIEGTSPSFFRNPKHLLLGSLSHIVNLAEKTKLSRTGNKQM